MFGESLRNAYDDIAEREMENGFFDEEKALFLKVTLAQKAADFRIQILKEDFLRETDADLSVVINSIGEVYLEAVELILDRFEVNEAEDVRLILNRVNDNVQNSPVLDALREMDGFPYIVEFRKNYQEIVDFLNFY